MKNKSTLLISFLLIATVILVGCKEEEEKAELPAEQQTAVAGMGLYIGSCYSQMDGDYLPLLEDPGSKAPPEGWTGPDEDDWYTKEDTIDQYSVSVRFYPGDPWADPPGDYWQIEWKKEWYDTTYQFKYYARCAYANEGADTTHVEGEWRLNYYFIYGEYDFSYVFKLLFDNVAVAYDDYTGHFVLECEYKYSSATTGQLVTATLTGEFTFESSGEGTGYIAAGGTEVVRYTFNCISGGNYTLLYENWAIEHLFGSCGK